jgi:cysteine synthase
MIICRKFGAQVHFTAAAKGIPGMQAHMDNLLASNPDYWNPKQERRWPEILRFFARAACFKKLVRE